MYIDVDIIKDELLQLTVGELKKKFAKKSDNYIENNLYDYSKRIKHDDEDDEPNEMLSNAKVNDCFIAFLKGSSYLSIFKVINVEDDELIIEELTINSEEKYIDYEFDCETEMSIFDNDYIFVKCSLETFKNIKRTYNNFNKQLDTLLTNKTNLIDVSNDIIRIPNSEIDINEQNNDKTIIEIVEEFNNERNKIIEHNKELNQKVIDVIKEEKIVIIRDALVFFDENDLKNITLSKDRQDIKAHYIHKFDDSFSLYNDKIGCDNISKVHNKKLAMKLLKINETIAEILSPYLKEYYKNY